MALYNQKKRWGYLLAGMTIELCAGLPYSWSVFQGLLAEKYQWTAVGTAGAYSFSSICMLTFTLLASGPLMRRFGLNAILFAGGVVYSVGTLGCGLIRGDLWELYLFYGVCIGVGTAMLYPTLTAYAVRLFPDRPGLASGVMVGGYGCGPFVIAPIVAGIYGRTANISLAFFVLGGAFLILILPLSLFLREPPAERGGDGGELGAASEPRLKDGPPRRSLRRREMLHSRKFYLLYGTFVIAITNGTMLLTQASPILRDNFGLSVSEAAGIVGALSLFNTAGRLVWGGISDKIGKSGSVIIIHVVILAGFALLLTQQFVCCVAALTLCVFCFGGASTLLAPSTAQCFGADTLEENFTVMFSMFSVAGVLGPMWITNAGYQAAFAGGTLMAAAGCLAAVIYHKRLAYGVIRHGKEMN